MKGNTMSKTIGTVLPTAASLKASDAHAKQVAKTIEQIASKKLKGCERRIVGGEVRYYDTTDQYAIVNSQGKVLWFQVTADGDYQI